MQPPDALLDAVDRGLGVRVQGHVGGHRVREAGVLGIDPSPDLVVDLGEAGVDLHDLLLLLGAQLEVAFQQGVHGLAHAGVGRALGRPMLADRAEAGPGETSGHRKDQGEDQPPPGACVHRPASRRAMGPVST